MDTLLFSDVEFFYCVNGLENVYKGRVVAQNGKVVWVKCPQISDIEVEVSLADIIDDWNYGFSDETDEKFYGWDDDDD